MSDPLQPEVTAPHAPAPEGSGDTTRPRNNTPAEPSDTTLVRGAIPMVGLSATAVPSANERYRLAAELARGGMGVVYRAEDVAFGREVAVKVLKPGLPDGEAVRRFFEEARITGRLEHPSVPPVYDLGTFPDGRPYLAMKLIRGETLTAKLAARESPGDDVHQFADIFEKVCQAVAFAHSRGIIHRDLKPGNIMVGAFGEVQVMDWGLAKELRAAREQADESTLPDVEPDGPEDRTRVGQVMGTPAYMPPEQARGDLDRVDERADVFALGGILCAILTGKPPYGGKTGRDVLQQAQDGNLQAAFTRLSRALDQLADVEEAVVVGPLVELARRCLSPNPAQRPAHAGEVAVMVNSARSKVQAHRRSIEIDQAVAGVEQATRSAMLSGAALNIGWGLRLMMFVLGLLLFGFCLAGPLRLR